MKKTEMVAGQRYLIELRDCCIEGDLHGVFLRWDVDHDDDEPTDALLAQGLNSFAGAVFDIGTIGPLWGKWEVKPEPESPEPEEVSDAREPGV